MVIGSGASASRTSAAAAAAASAAATCAAYSAAAAVSAASATSCAVDGGGAAGTARPTSPNRTPLPPLLRRRSARVEVDAASSPHIAVTDAAALPPPTPLPLDGGVSVEVPDLVES